MRNDQLSTLKLDNSLLTTLQVLGLYEKSHVSMMKGSLISSQ